MGWMSDESGLEKNKANYAPLTPLSHLRRASTVFSDRTAVIYGSHRKNYYEYYQRCSQLASALEKIGIKPGDVVATVLPNIPAQAEAHFGVPACGAVLNTINTRLDLNTITYIFEHGGAKLVFADTQFLSVVEDAIAKLEGPRPTLIEVPDEFAAFQQQESTRHMKVF